MSYITDVVVHIDYASRRVHEKLREAFYAGMYTSDNPRIERLKEVSTSDAGGGKVFTGTILAGSYNHFDTIAFIDWLNSLPWGGFDHAVVSIVCEGDEAGDGRVYHLKKDGLFELCAYEK